MITEALIEELVHGFYARVRRDPDLGPIFASVIVDWTPHLSRMVDFWSSVMLQTRRFKGNPVLKHNALPDLEPRHFDIWLGLFRENAREVCEPETAEAFIGKAELIAESLMLARFGLPKRVQARSARVESQAVSN